MGAQDDDGSRGAIWDPAFQRAHKRLMLLSEHLLRLTTTYSNEVRDAARLGALNTVLYSKVPFNARTANAEEWAKVEDRSQTIWSALTEAQRRQFITAQVPGWFSYVLSALLLLALSSVFVGFLIAINFWPQWRGGQLIPFMTFVIALGAMGASASIGMNALSLQDDATFDISSPKFLWLRLLLGALLGAVLTFPWGFDVYKAFIQNLANDPALAKELNLDNLFDKQRLVQALALLMPFVLGFSTSLVILILARAVEAVQTFFGKTTTAAPVP